MALCTSTALKALIPHKLAGARFARERLRFVRGETFDMAAATFRTYDISPPATFTTVSLRGAGFLRGRFHSVTPAPMSSVVEIEWVARPD